MALLIQKNQLADFLDVKVKEIKMLIYMQNQGSEKNI